MDRITLALSERLQATSRRLLMHALEHALSESPDEDDVLQTIVNLQAAVELFSKLYVLRREGWRSIIDEKLHSKPEEDLLSAIEAGTIKTIQFWKSRKLASETLTLDDDDTQLLDNFQRRRNQLMHLGLVSPSKGILNEAIWFVVRIIHELGWKQALEMRDQYLSNSLEVFIGSNLYNRLVSHSAYVAEAVDRADTLYPDSLRYCLECGRQAMVENEEEDYLCFVCGFQSPTHAIGFADCTDCGEKSNVAYDKLNIGFFKRSPQASMKAAIVSALAGTVVKPRSSQNVE